MNVKARAEAVGTFRHINVFLMETLAGWVPTTPEMEAKVLFGRHLWLLAQQADKLGKRSRELRAPLHFSRPPAESYAKALEALAALEHTGVRLEGLYQAALPSLGNAYANYLAQTDRLIDEPTVVILEEAARDIDRMRRECVALLDEFPAIREGAADAVAAIRRAFSDAGEVIDLRTQAQPA